MDRIVIAGSGSEETSSVLRQRLEAEGHVVIDCSSPEAAIEAVRGGASCVVLSQVIGDVVSSTVRRPVSALTDVALIGETPSMRAIKETIQRLGQSPNTAVVISGESGAGKDAVARAIHAATAPDRPFVYVSPRALSEAMLEVELFGSEPAQGSGEARRIGLVEQGSGGTLFIDEIADIAPALQNKLARFLEDKTFRPVGAATDRACETRVIASTTQELDTLTENGTLRPDFVYRLAVVVVEVPPLRQRRSDIPLLVDHLLRSLSSRLGKAPSSVSTSAMNMLMEHTWPGNVRELSNVLERAVLLGGSDVIDARHLSIPPSTTAGVRYRLPPEGIDFRSLEKEVVSQALRIARGNQTRAATLLGMTRDQIRYRMAKFGMSTQDAIAASARDGNGMTPKKAGGGAPGDDVRAA